MAYARRTRSSGRRTTRRSTSSRTSYRSRAVRRPARSRSTGRRSSGGSGRTIRIEIVNSGAGSVARPEIGSKPASAPRKAQF